jgi:RES domain-containing protein
MLSAPNLGPAVTAVRPTAVPLSTVAYRSIHLQHFVRFATARPLLAALGGLVGSRYVPPGGPPAIYMTLDVETAHREGNQAFYQAAHAPAGPALLRAGGLRPNPAVLLGIYVRVARLLDLRDPGVQGQLATNPAELVGPWRFVPNAPTQQLGHTIFSDNHFEGMLFPSAQNLNHTCLVIFPGRLLTASRVDFRDPVTRLAQQLP